VSLRRGHNSPLPGACSLSFIILQVDPAVQHQIPTFVPGDRIGQTSRLGNRNDIITSLKWTPSVESGIALGSLY
ncbi:unnamed protein product, partial [Hymenolepis diminuta]